MKFSTGKFYEHYKRSVAKTVAYRILIIISSYVIVYGITQEHETTTMVVILSNFTNTVIYFFHERIWNQTHWGKSVKK